MPSDSCARHLLSIHPPDLYSSRKFQPVSLPFGAGRMAGFAKPLENEIIADSEPEEERQRAQNSLGRKESNKKARLTHDVVGPPRKSVPVYRRLQSHSIITVPGESSLILPGNRLNQECSGDNDVSFDISVKTREHLAKTVFVTEEQDLAQPTLSRVRSTLRCALFFVNFLIPFEDDQPSMSPPLSAENYHDETVIPLSGRMAQDPSSERVGSPETKRKMLDLARYTYTNPRSPSASIVSRPSISQVPSEVSRHTSSNPTNIRRLACHRFTAVGNSDLARLPKCVSCELYWTSRKTALQKMKHMEMCAKKNKLEDDTVITLIRMELMNADDRGTSNSKQPGVETKPNTVTLLESAVQKAAPNKRRRRLEVIGTVKQLSDTRQQILNRARLLLQSQPSVVEQADVLSNSSIPRPASPPLLTQPFGESILAQKYQDKLPPESPQIFSNASGSSQF